MKKLLYGLLALGCLACGKTDDQPADLLTSNDFEELDGWLDGSVNQSLTTDKAHSGTHSVKVAPGLDYSFGYNNTLGRLSSARIKKIKIHGWVFLPNERATPVLVADVRNPGQEQSLLWEKLDLNAQGKADGFNKWVEVTKEITLPAAATYNSQLKVYMWRGDSSQPTYLDDLQLTKVD